MNVAKRQLRRSRLVVLAALALGGGCHPAPTPVAPAVEQPTPVQPNARDSINCEAPACTPRGKPLYVIDGVALDSTKFPLARTTLNPSGRFEPLKPSEIDSIKVMRGPKAIQEFGPAAKNGVVLVWTKRGAKPLTPDTGKVQAAPPPL